jgi:hypothetical protein
LLTLILAYIDAENLVRDPGAWWYLATVLVDLFVLGAFSGGSK